MMKNIYKLSVFAISLGLMSPNLLLAQNTIDRTASGALSSPGRPNFGCNRPKEDMRTSKELANKPCIDKSAKNYNENQKKMIANYKEQSRPKIVQLKKEHKDLLIQKENAKTSKEKAQLETQALALREKRIAYKKEFKEFREKLEKAQSPN